MSKIYKVLAINFVFIATAFLLTGCDSNHKNSSNGSTSQQEDYIAKARDIQDKLNTIDQQKLDLSFPSWLSSLKILEPQNMQLDEKSSYQTTKEIEGFDSIHFVYNGDYNVAMTQAKKIATYANVPVSKEFKMAQDILNNLSSGQELSLEMQDLLGDMKGIIYTNYDLLDANNPDYTIAITVDESGSLELDITDMKEMKKITGQYTK